MTQEPFGDEQLKFPLDCQFRIIAENKDGMHFVIETVLMEHGITSPLEAQNQSSGGKYQSFLVVARMESREQMNRIDAALRTIVGVKMVL
jgi:putative lipoic acid-binding regulatory protein